MSASSDVRVLGSKRARISGGKMFPKPVVPCLQDVGGDLVTNRGRDEESSGCCHGESPLSWPGKEPGSTPKAVGMAF